MTLPNSPSLDEIIAAFLEELDAGSAPDPLLFADRYPDHRTEFLKFVQQCEQLQGWTGSSSLKSGNISSTGSLPPKKTLGAYRLEEQIGRGGMSRVYRASRIGDGTSAALKVLDAGFSVDPAIEQRFRREAQAIKAIEHAHIVPLLDYGTDQGISFLALKFIDGCTLADLIRGLSKEGFSEPRTTEAARLSSTVESHSPSPGSLQSATQNNPLQPESGCSSNLTRKSVRSLALECFESYRPTSRYYERIAGLIASVAEALEAAHEKGIVHRDVKPSNLMLDRQGNVWLTDFGLASLGEAQTVITHTGQVVGTPHYMSPEQAGGKLGKIDGRSDVYSLGATLYELATLHRPHDGDRFRVLMEIASGRLQPPSHRNPSIPRPLEAIILKAMSLKPDARYATASAMAADLQSFVGGEKITARVPGVADKLVKWIVSNPRKSLASAVVGLAAVVLVMFLQYLNGERLENLNDQLADTNLQLSASNAQLDQSQQSLQRQVYVSDMAAAYRAFEQSDMDAVHQFLSRHIPGEHDSVGLNVDQRGFEWWLLEGLSGPPSVRTLGTHEGKATEVLLRLKNNDILTAGHDGCIRRWPLSSKEPDNSLEFGGQIDCLAVSPDEKLMVVAQNVPEGMNPVSLRSTQDGRIIKPLTGHEYGVESAAISHDSRWVATAGRYNDVLLHDIEGELQARLASGSRNETLAFGPDSRYLFVVCREQHETAKEQYLAKCKLPNLEIAERCEVGFGPMVVAISAEGNRLLAADDSRLALLELEPWTPLVRLNDIRGRIRCIALSESGEVIVAGCDNGLLHVWDLSSWQVSEGLPAPQVINAGANGITSVKVHGLDEIVASSQDGAIRIWQLGEAQVADTTFGAESVSLAVMAGEQNSIYTRSMAGRTFEVRLDTRSSTAIEDLCFEQGRRIAIAQDRSCWVVDDENGIIIFDEKLQQKHRIPFPANYQVCKWLQLVDGDRRLLALFQDRLQCYSLSDGKLLKEVLIEDEGADRFYLSPDQSSVIVVSRNFLRWLDGSTLEAQHKSKAEFSELTFAKYSNQGHYIAVGRQDGTVELLHASSRQRARLLPGHRRGVDDCVFIHQDQTLITVSSDDSLRFWDVASGRELGKFSLGKGNSAYRLHFSARHEALFLLQSAGPIRQFSGRRH